MPLDSIRAGGAFVRAHGRHAISISTRPTRSVSADGCRKSGWLTTAFCRLSDGRVQNVWSVTVVYVRSVLLLVTKAQCVYRSDALVSVAFELDTELSAPRKTGRSRPARRAR